MRNFLSPISLFFYLFLLSFPLLLPAVAHAFKNIGFLKGGISTGIAELNSLGKKDFFIGAGFNTHAGYRFTNLELQLSSYIYIAKMNEGMVFNSNGETVVATGNIRNVSFSPIAKYFTQYEPKKNWKLYISGGPLVSLQSIKLKSYTDVNGASAKNHKITFQSYGASFGLGIEEITTYKEMHPVYLEIIYQIQKSHKANIVDATDTKMVRTLKSEESSEKVLNQMILLNFGMTIF